MSKVNYSVVKTEDDQNVTLYVPGRAEPLIANGSHANFNRIVVAIVAADALDTEPDYDKLLELYDLPTYIKVEFERLSDRAVVRDDKFYFDGDELNSTLTNHVLRFLNEGVEDWKPLIQFLDKISQNPREDSQRRLYDWLDAQDYTISPEGDIVGYKSVYSNGTGGYESVTAGPAIVDGRPHERGRVPNNPGTVVEMARSEVVHDPGQACAHGLHVGTYAYAQTWSGDVVLEVRVNPRDVVSVPNSGEHKMRVCRYVVVRAVDSKYDTAYIDTPSPVQEETHDVSQHPDDGCEVCGEPLDDCICDELCCDGCGEVEDNCTCGADRCEDCGEMLYDCLCCDEGVDPDPDEDPGEPEPVAKPTLRSKISGVFNRQSPLDSEEVVHQLADHCRSNSSNKDVADWVWNTFQIQTTPDSIRRFRKRHDL